MTKKPFSFFLELLFVLFFFLITSTILIEIYAKMVQISQTDTYRQDAMVIAQNKIETSASVGEYSQEMHDNIYDVKISNVNRNEYCIRIYLKCWIINIIKRRITNETIKNRIRCSYNAKHICRCLHVCIGVVFIK